MEPIGVIAGNGRFPILFAQSARRGGRKVVVVAHEGETLPEISAVADVLDWVKLGQLGKMIKVFKTAGVTEAVMCGGITKSRMFSKVRPDFRGATLFFKMKSRQDDGLLRAVAREFEDEGIQIRESTLYVPELLAAPGCYTKKKPSPSEESDLQLGFQTAKGIGRLDIGQAVVVRAGTIVAVEAMEGTDAMIERGGTLAGKNAVVVKVSKPSQDLRFDVPSVGIDTVRKMLQSGCSVLGLEAGKTLVFDKEEMVKEADRHRICIVAREV